MVLEFSNPSIQGFSDYIKLTDEKEIMYYYYTVKIFKKINEYTDDDKEIVKLKLVSKQNTYDFPCILQLKWILDYQLKDNTMIDGQKNEYKNGNIRYSKVISTEGFACDDFYEITKSVNSKGKDDKYIVYCGTSFDLQGALNSSGIRTPYVSKIDIEELFKCVSNFIEYSLETHNKENTNLHDRLEIKYNKIYEYFCNQNKVDKNRLESIFAIGDVLNIITVVDNEQIEHNKVTISKIDDDFITLNNGNIINFKTIVYISNEIFDEKLRYKENEIAQEFLSILADDEKSEIKELSVDSLLNKYKIAIIDRTWMCRTEHEFDINYNEDVIETITPIVKEVINIIKNKL